MMMMSGMSFEKKRHHRHATLDFEPECLEHTPTLFVLRNFITIVIEKKRKERNNDPERPAYGSKHHESEFRAKNGKKKSKITEAEKNAVTEAFARSERIEGNRNYR